MKKNKIILVLVLVVNGIIGCEEGEFVAYTGGAINLTIPRQDALCEGGEPQTNGRIIIPLVWSVEGSENFESFTINIYDPMDSENPIASNQTQNGEERTTQIELERGQNLIWQVLGNIAGNTEPIRSSRWGFYSESIPQEDNAPLPTRITNIERRLDNFFITWENDNEDIDELTYNIYRSIDANIQDVVNQNSYTKIGNTRSETDSKELTLLFSELPDKGDYIFRVETIKSITGNVQFTTNSYSRFTY